MLVFPWIFANFGDEFRMNDNESAQQYIYS